MNVVQWKKKRLRQEMAILNGDDEDPVENEADEEKRSMKIMLKSGIIPDALAIHAARKKREQARGQGGDFIALTSGHANKRDEKSRLVRYTLFAASLTIASTQLNGDT